MSSRPKASVLLLVTAASAGAILAHSLTYLLAMRSVTVRDAVLSATGHGYWPAAVSIAIVAAIIAIAGVAARHFRAGLHGGAVLVGDEPWKILAVRLAALQMCIFLLQETFERIAAHAPLQTLVQNKLLFFGLLAQAAVAVAIASLLRAFAAAARAAGRAFSHPMFIGRPHTAVRTPVTSDVSFSDVVLGALRTRAPPSPAAA
jgi:hypothetical protein